MVEVFKTNVYENKEASELLDVLSEQFPAFKINFDLDDCDKILRVEGEEVNQEKIIALITASGYECITLD